MAQTFGEPGKNPYPLTGISGIFSNVVNSETGVTQVYKQNAFLQFQSIGTFNPKTNVFTPDPNANLSPNEIVALNNNKTQIKDAAIKTATNAGATNATQLLSQNTAQSGDAENQESSTAPLTAENISTTIPDSQLTRNLDNSLKVNLRYPVTLNGSQDRVKFSVKQFLGRSGIQNVNSQGFTLGTRSVSEILGSVTLPIQPSISDSNGVDWGGANLNPIQAYAAGLSLSVATSEGNITGEAARVLNKAATDFKTGLENSGYKEAIQLYFAQEAVGAQNLLSRTSGAILNPNLELLFNGPTLRSFNFTFKLSPRSSPEAIVVKKIINWFKKAMAVKKSESEVFLKAPNIFDIEYQSGEGNPHKSLNKIKTCALLGCDVDYSPDGSYMTFNDEGRTMTSYQLTLRFSELDPIYNTDYDDSELKGNEIGY